MHPMQRPSFCQALAKAREHNFFLGMDWRWAEE
jgi:hypothetical protein